MQSVIASYDNLPQAYRAVRQLERRQSITGVFVTDARKPGWRRFRPDPDAGTRSEMGGRFLVVMTEEPEVIARARALIAHNS